MVTSTTGSYIDKMSLLFDSAQTLLPLLLFLLHTNPNCQSYRAFAANELLTCAKRAIVMDSSNTSRQQHVVKQENGLHRAPIMT